MSFHDFRQEAVAAGPLDVWRSGHEPLHRRNGQGNGNALPPWREVEDAFRVWLFGQAFRRVQHMPDPYWRFAHALVASSKPIQDRAVIIGWFRRSRGKRANGRAKEANR